MRFIDSTMPPCSGVAPPARPVPAPRGVTGMPRACAQRTSPATWSVERGSTITSGMKRSSVSASAS